MNLELIKLTLTVVSGACWTVVYIDGIRLGFKHRSYAIPFYALALNISWEIIYTYYGFQSALSAQAVINAVWLLFDVGILFTYFKFGRKYFPWVGVPAESGVKPPHSKFIGWSVLGLITAFGVQYGFMREFGVAKGAAYSAFPQNLIMSILFIAMLVKRNSREGQSLLIAISKWIGTLAPTILYGAIGQGGFPRGSFLILTVGLFCSVFDVIYIWLLAKTKPAQAGAL